MQNTLSPLRALDAWVVARASTEAVQFLAVRELTQLRQRSGGTTWLPLAAVKASPEDFAEAVGVKKLPATVSLDRGAEVVAGLPGVEAVARLVAEPSPETTAIVSGWLDACCRQAA